MISAIINKIKNQITRCIITKVDPKKPYTLANIKGLKDSKAEYISPYGLTGICPPNTMGIRFFIGGISHEQAVLAYSGNDDFQERGDLEDGEVLAGSPYFEVYIKFDKDKKVTIKGSSEINLGEGGQPIARKGDQIKVNIGGTDYIGEIITGGNNKST